MNLPINFFYRLINAPNRDRFVTILHDARPSEIVELETILAPFDSVTRDLERSAEPDYTALLFKLAEDAATTRRHLARALYQFFKQQHKRSFYECMVTE